MGPVAFIQVDLDGLWAVRRCYGAAGSPEQDDPVYAQALPALVGLFDRLGVKATFFVVGADVQISWKRHQLEAARDAGHEVANHSMTHHLGFARGIAAEEMRQEIIACQDVLRDALGIEARGFRAPGYGYSKGLLAVLEELGFWYDASLLPTAWAWLMRGFDRWISSNACSNRYLYGQAGGWRAPRIPHKARTQLWEVPVSVSRHLRLPFHGGIGFLLGRRWAERGVRQKGFLNYVIHGMDLIDGDKWPVTTHKRGWRFFAGTTRDRLDFIAAVCGRITERFEVLRTNDWIAGLRKANEND